MLLYWIDPTFPYPISTGSDMFFNSILFVSCGFLLKVQKRITQDLLSVLFLALLVSACLSILAFEYDYISSILHQNTPDLKIFTEESLREIRIFCLPLDWFLQLPESTQSIKPYYIIFAGIYPSTMIFVGMQIKRMFLLMKKH
jgi:hypothetical protein